MNKLALLTEGLWASNFAWKPRGSLLLCAAFKRRV